MKITDQMERHQVCLYLVAIATGGLLALNLPGVGIALEPLVSPALALLLLATFTSIPLRMPRGEYAFPRGFISDLLTLNCLLNPLLVVALTITLPLSDPLAFAVALVLLAPCIDYVVVFCGIAGGSREDLTRATPILLLAQAVAVPLWLLILGGFRLWEKAPITADALSHSLPATTAALAVILIPLALAWIIQTIGAPLSNRLKTASEAGMVPLMMTVLLTTVAAHFGAVREHLYQLAPVVAAFTLFAAITATYSWFYSGQRTGAADYPTRTALVFSAVTRNSLVVLPIALAAAEISNQPLIPLAVVTQTLVELIAMVTLIKIFRHLRSRAETGYDRP